MLEEIRHKIMNRNNDMRKFVEIWISDISPMARMILEENKELSRRCKVRFNGQDSFEIEEGDKRFIVNLVAKTCICRSWMLRGIPCRHALCSYYHLEQDPEQHVKFWYRKEIFLKAYKYYLQPMPNMKMWPESNNPVIESPEPNSMSGRPKICKRKVKYEPKKAKYGKISKKGVKMTCS
ncbi:uncharacterized protein LOC142165787 [Nicotiana tabacum]|uniref:Uncharacterized protein LOC142165787 n=1 Tax=Nicotiana tabacum TaxID=4097 RepID=A0AC58S5J6_TOBAC